MQRVTGEGRNSSVGLCNNLSKSLLTKLASTFKNISDEVLNPQPLISEFENIILY